MSNVHHYKSNLDDLFFNLFEYLDIGTKTLGQGKYEHLDVETMRDAISGFEKLATTELAASFAESDRTPLTLDDDGNITLPAGLTQSLKAFYDGGWDMLETPTELGGIGSPPTVRWGAFELLVGANPPLAFYTFGNYLSRIINSCGTESQKARYVTNMIERRWGGAMVLTEPDAGSDVGAGRSRATHIEGDVWDLTGVKRFITNADYDYPENIVHLVLARPEGHQAGTKGLSMFIVPKYWVEEDGSLGERNGAFVTNIEKKMGLKGSCTCELTLGDRMPCRGLLVGEVHDGIRQMFMVIEHARMAVGMKSMSTLSTAYLHALEYCKERIQGPDLAKAAEKDSPRVRIIEHPDVRRMLMHQKSHAEGLRAMALYTASIQDGIELAGGHGKSVELDRYNDLLLPLVKGFASHRVWEILGNESLQCFGGAGYVKDYPIEQYCRDQKIDSLYEGTTHIQALDLFFRKIARDGGETLKGHLGRIQKTIAVLGDDMAVEKAALTRALGDVQSMFMTMLGKLRESIYHVGFQGNRLLLSLAELTIGWLLVDHARLAGELSDGATGRRQAYLRGKQASARYFCQNVLPTLTLTRKLIEAGDLSLMDVPEDSF